MSSETSCRIIRGAPSLLSSARLTLPLLVVSLHWDADVRCYPQWNRGRRLTTIGAMYKYTPAESSPEGTRVWEHTCSTRYASRHLPMQANLNAAQENQKNENTRRMDIQPYIYMPSKNPGKMSRQTKRSVQTHYFKFKHQFKLHVIQCATTIPLHPAIALSTGFYHINTLFL